MTTATNLAMIETPDYSAKWEPECDIWDTYALVESGTGFMTAYGADTMQNYDAYVFMEDQYRRFGITPPEEDMLQWCWNFAFYCMDQLDPYLFYSGCTDVIKTNEPYFYQFAVRYDDYQPFKEISADSTEVFRVWKDGMVNWQMLMANPGLNSPKGSEYFSQIWDYFDEHFTYVMKEDRPEVRKSYNAELALVRKYGDKTNHIAHLGIWSAVMWMLGPDGAGWRTDYNPIFKLCYEEGAVLLHDWTFHAPMYFKRFERPVKSCAHCGEKQYCVELTQLPEESVYYEETDVTAIYMCQKCQSKGEPFPGRTCGTKMCTNLDCRNHPSYSSDMVLSGAARRQMDAAKRYGELRDVGVGYEVRELPGMMYINHQMINKYSASIASDVGQKMLDMLMPK